MKHTPITSPNSHRTALAAMETQVAMMKVTLKPPHSAMLENGGAGSATSELKTRFPFRRRRRPAEAGRRGRTKRSA